MFSFSLVSCHSIAGVHKCMYVCMFVCQFIYFVVAIRNSQLYARVYTIVHTALVCTSLEMGIVWTRKPWKFFEFVYVEIYMMYLQMAILFLAQKLFCVNYNNVVITSCFYKTLFHGPKCCVAYLNFGLRSKIVYADFAVMLPQQTAFLW